MVREGDGSGSRGTVDEHVYGDGEDDEEGEEGSE